MKFTKIAVVSMGLLCANVCLADTSTMQPGNQTQSQTTNAKKVGEAFLLANKQKPGVVTLPDGLQYRIIKEGQGASPTDSDTVVVNYAGKLINGKEFDSSYKRGEPITFQVTGVIPGWVEALKLMKPGSKWELYIPAALAYGEQGAPPAIGPNETLIFTVELLNVKK